MSVQEHEHVLAQANDAVRALYGAPPRGTGLAAVDGQAGPVADEALAQAALDRSAACTDTTAELLHHDDPAVRAVGAARLGALAARDFAIAHDLAGLADEGEQGVATTGVASALADVEADIQFVLAGDPADGLPSLNDMGGAELASADDDPRATLRAAAPKAQDSIRDDALAIVTGSVKGIGTATIPTAVGALLTDIIDHLPAQAQHWYQRARNFILEGVKKLKAVFGDRFDAAVDKVKGWLTDNGPNELADAVFGLDQLTTDLENAIDSAPDERPFAKVGDDVQDVVGRFATQKTVVLAVFKAMGYAGKWVVNLVAPGAGTPVVNALYVLGAAYGIFVAGDYMDWHLTADEGAFDFVVGVRRTVQEGLA